MANTPEVIALSSNTSQIGSTIIITSSGGEGVVSTSIKWTYKTYTGDASLGNFTFDDSFEELELQQEYLNVVFTMTSTFEDATTASTTATCRVNIPDKYSPTIYVENITAIPKVNGHTRAPAAAAITFSVNEEGSATHQVTLTNLVSAAPVTYRINGSTISMTLPTISASEYNVSFRINVTDSRGRTDYTNVSAARFGTVYCYDAPKVNIVNIFRCDENGNEKPNGRYAKITGSVEDTSTPYSCTCLINSVTYACSFVNKNFYVVVGNNALELGVNYPFTLSYTSTYMRSHSISAMTVNGTVSMQKVPISLIDNGYLMGVSVGDMADDYDDVSADVVLNLASNSEVRASDANGSVVESAYNIVNLKNHVENILLDGFKIKVVSESKYKKIRNKDYKTIYIVY